MPQLWGLGARDPFSDWDPSYGGWDYGDKGLVDRVVYEHGPISDRARQWMEAKAGELKGAGGGNAGQIVAALYRDNPFKASSAANKAADAGADGTTRANEKAAAEKAAAEKAAAEKAAAEKAAAEEKAKRDALAKPLQDRLAELTAAQNPFGQDYIHGQQQQASLAFGGQQHALSGQLAGRGMMGGGAEIAQRTGLAGAQGATLMDIANQAKTQGIGWDVNKRNAGDALAANISNILMGGRGQDINMALGQAGIAMQGRGQDINKSIADQGNDYLNKQFAYTQQQDTKNYVHPYVRAALGVIPAVAGVGGGILEKYMNRPSAPPETSTKTSGSYDA